MRGKHPVPPMDPTWTSINHSTKVEGRPGAAFKIIYNSKDQSVSCEHA